MPRPLARLLAGALAAGTLAAGSLVGAAVTASPAAAAPAVVPGPAFGAQVHAMWSDYTDDQRGRVLDQLRAAGATWVRIDLGWKTLQPTRRDAYDPWGVAFADRVVEMATARGLTPLITLWLTPAWANGGKGDRVLPTDPADYARVAAWAARRWAGKVGAWEVWNEANSPSFMVGADPVAYTRLLRAAYPAFKSGDPAAQVVFSGTEYNDDRWIARAYAAGARGSFDVMATHPYQGRADAAPETPDDGTIWTLRHAEAVHRLMVAQGDGHKPLWFTEFGWSSHGRSNEGLANWDRGVSEQQQGEYLVRTLRLVAAEMPYVTNVFWYSDRDRNDGNLRLDHYGLLRYDLTPKPALLAVQSYLSGTAAPPEGFQASLTGAPSGSRSVAVAPTAGTPAAVLQAPRRPGRVSPLERARQRVRTAPRG